MEEAEKLSLSTSLPELIKEIKVNTKFKANLLSSGLVDDDYLDSLLEKNNNQNLVFRFIQSLKKANEKSGFRTFQQVLRSVGQTTAADILETELTKHTQRLRDTGTTQLSGGTTSTTDQHFLHPKAQENVKRLEGAGTTENKVPFETVPVVNYEDLKEKLRRILPKRGSRRVAGDVTVPEQYYRDVYNFTSGASATPPGPLPEIDIAKPTHIRETLRYMTPGACAQLTRALGGEISLTFFQDEGHSVLRSCDLTVKYCVATIFTDPGGIPKRVTWMSTDLPLRETLAHCTSWPEFEGRFDKTNEVLDLSLSGAYWYQRSLSMRLTISRKGPNVQQLSKEERRTLLHEHVKKAEEKVLVTRKYGTAVFSFAKGTSHEEPGPLMSTDDKLAVHNNHNLAYLPIECSSLLIDMYGGSAKLVKGKRHNCKTLDDMHSNTRYVGVEILMQTQDSSQLSLGQFYLTVHRELIDSIGAAVGWFPTRVQTIGDDVDIDLHIGVREWFDTSKSVRLLVWD